MGFDVMSSVGVEGEAEAVAKVPGCIGARGVLNSYNNYIEL